MKKFSIPVVNAFVDAGTGGNPAGIVLDADRFDYPTKQAIAAKVGLSETAFISSSRIADFKLEFFTPIRQIAQCGHATIAAFSYLVQQKLVTKKHCSMETVDGIRAIYLEDDQAFMEQTAPTFSPPDRLDSSAVGTSAILQSLGSSAGELAEGFSPLVVNTGNSFLIVPMRSASAVRRLLPNQKQIHAISEKLGLIGYYAFSTDVQKPGRDAAARMFAPAYGIAEEAATGMAAGPLACYLYTYRELHKPSILVEQGHLMHPPSPSLLTARLQLEQGLITGLMVGGRATVSQSLEIELDSFD